MVAQSFDQRVQQLDANRDTGFSPAGGEIAISYQDRRAAAKADQDHSQSNNLNSRDALAVLDAALDDAKRSQFSVKVSDGVQSGRPTVSIAEIASQANESVMDRLRSQGLGHDALGEVHRVVTDEVNHRATAVAGEINVEREKKDQQAAAAQPQAGAQAQAGVQPDANPELLAAAQPKSVVQPDAKVQPELKPEADLKTQSEAQGLAAAASQPAADLKAAVDAAKSALAEREAQAGLAAAPEKAAYMKYSPETQIASAGLSPDEQSRETLTEKVARVREQYETTLARLRERTAA